MKYYMRLAKAASSMGYPENIIALNEILKGAHYEDTGCKSLEAFRKKFFRGRKQDFEELNIARLIQLQLIGEDRIGEWSLENCLALGVVSTHSQLYQLVDALGGINRIKKVLPHTITNKAWQLFADTLSARDATERQKAHEHIAKYRSRAEYYFEELPMSDKFKFFQKYYEHFLDYEFPNELRWFVDYVEIMQGHLARFNATILEGTETARDPSLRQFKSVSEQE